MSLAIIVLSGLNSIWNILDATSIWHEQKCAERGEVVKDNNLISLCFYFKGSQV